MFAAKYPGTLSKSLANRFIPALQLGARRGLKAYPYYTVFGDQCMMQLKLLPPLFRYLPGSDTLALDSGKKGRMLLEWTPRTSEGSLSREKDVVLRFGLSAEEMGLLLLQIPKDQPVELVRKATGTEAMFQASSVPHKVCRVVPNPDVASVTWTMDFELDGVGGQVLQKAQGPLSVEMQAGEVQVVLQLMRETIPVLTGWKTLQEVAVRRMVDDALPGAGQTT